MLGSLLHDVSYRLWERTGWDFLYPGTSDDLKSERASAEIRREMQFEGDYIDRVLHEVDEKHPRG